jgi:FkbM family methyltransferase
MSAHERVQGILLERTPLRDRATRKRLVHARRRLFEAAGSDRYSRPAFDDIDAKLRRYLPTTGVFVEAGANDGYTWSNTYYLGRWRGWSGVLIEGIPALSDECRRLRTRSRVYNCALVAPDFAETHVSMTYSDLRSLITGSELHMEAVLAQKQEELYEVRVRADTIDHILDDAGIGRPDFITLDLEGSEANALRGLDLVRHGPTWLLVEVASGEGREGVETVLGDHYEAAARLTPGDVLYRRCAD